MARRRPQEEMYAVKARDLDEEASNQRQDPNAFDSLLSDQALRRFCLRNDLQQVSGKSTFEQLRQFCHGFLQEFIDKMTVYASHEFRFVLILKDVANTSRLMGIPMYGIQFAGQDLPPGHQSFHATEMLEYPSIFAPREEERMVECEAELEPESLEAESHLGCGNGHTIARAHQQQPNTNARVAHFRRTDFVANLKQSMDEDDSFIDEMVCSDDEDEWDFDEEDSDSSSDCFSDGFEEEESEDENEEETTDRILQKIQLPTKSMEQRKAQMKRRFIRALENAQHVVDQELLKASTSHSNHHQSSAVGTSNHLALIDEDDAAIGQGYYSDYGIDLHPRLVPEWKQVVQNEEKCWKQEGQFWFSDPDLTADLLQQSNSFEMDRNPYLLPRELVFQLFHCFMTQSMWRITSAALSALHNIFEQHLHFHLQNGRLRYQILSQIEQETSATLYQENTELREEIAFQREQVTTKIQEMNEMTQVFKSKELEMQRKIQRLEYLLQDFQQQEQQRFRRDFSTPRRNTIPAEEYSNKIRSSPGFVGSSSASQTLFTPSYRQELHYQPRGISPGKRKAFAGPDPAMHQDAFTDKPQQTSSSPSPSSTTAMTTALTTPTSFGNKFLAGLQKLRSKKARINPA